MRMQQMMCARKTGWGHDGNQESKKTLAFP